MLTSQKYARLTNMIKVELIDVMGSDLTTVNAARVSFGKRSSYDEGVCGEWLLPEKDKKLIKYLAKHEHLSPFGHCFASFHVKAPIFVARQLVKHKFLRWNEISRRYVDEEPEFYVPEVWRGRSADKKQGSEGEIIDDNKWSSISEWLNFEVLRVYKSMIEQGVAPEQARMILPQSTMTEWFWSGSLDAFAAMCKLRLKEDTQYESRVVAQQIDKHMQEHFPESWKALVHDTK
jgi:thymidylate synthase (FAD)